MSQKLYNLGARKIIVFGLGQLGCMPGEIALHGTNGKPCVEWINDAVKLFNDQLKHIVEKLNKEHNCDAKFTFINITSMSAPQEGNARVQNLHIYMVFHVDCYIIFFKHI